MLTTPLRALLLCCLLPFAACQKPLVREAASFKYLTNSQEHGDKFQQAFQAFLAAHGFVPSPAPTFWGTSGGHVSGVAETWLKGSYLHSPPFYLRYETTQTPAGLVLIQADTVFEILGNEADGTAMQSIVHEFSEALSKIAADHKNLAPIQTPTPSP